MKTNYPDKYASLTSKNFFLVTGTITGWSDGSHYAYTSYHASYNATTGIVTVGASSRTTGGSAQASASYTVYYTETPLP